MITEVKERQVSMDIPGMTWPFEATVRDGVITEISALSENPPKKDVEGYIEFLTEVLQAIKETEGE